MTHSLPLRNKLSILIKHLSNDWLILCNLTVKLEVHIQGVPKKVTIGPPKPQFLSETFEILVVGRLFHSRFSAVFRVEKF